MVRMGFLIALQALVRAEMQRLGAFTKLVGEFDSNKCPADRVTGRFPLYGRAAARLRGNPGPCGARPFPTKEIAQNTTYQRRDDQQDDRINKVH